MFTALILEPGNFSAGHRIWCPAEKLPEKAAVRQKETGVALSIVFVPDVADGLCGSGFFGHVLDYAIDFFACLFELFHIGVNGRCLLNYRLRVIS